MAKMNNLEVKAVKWFPDHDGAMIPYGNVYFNNKKVGSFRTDSWGGPMQYDHTHKTITEKELMDAFSGIVTKLGWNEFYDSLDILIDELVGFKELESSFKKSQKKGKILMVLHEDRYQKPFEVSSSFVPTTVYEVSERANEKDIHRFSKDIIEENNGRGVISVYRTLDDFIL